MEDDIEYLSGQIDALTKLCMSFAILHMQQSSNVKPIMESFVGMLARDLKNDDLSKSHRQGIDAVRSVLVNVLQIGDQSPER
jgi:hypothetical protein